MSVFIIGAPATGKSTLANVVKEKNRNANVFSFEAIRNGFIKSQPELKMGDRNSLARREILPSFIVEFARWNEQLEGGLSVVEGSFASVENLFKLISDDDRVVCLGFGGKDKHEIAQIVLGRVTKDNYLYGCTTKKFIGHFYDIDKRDKEDMEFCQRHSIPYFDTSEGWSEVETALSGMLIETL